MGPPGDVQLAVTCVNPEAHEPGFQACPSVPSGLSLGLAFRSIRFLICKMGIMRVGRLTERLREVSAMIHETCSAQNLRFVHSQCI